MTNRIFALVLTVLLAVTLFAGCAAQAPVAEGNAPAPEAAGSESQRVADSDRAINEESLVIHFGDPGAGEEILDGEVPLAPVPAAGPLTKRDAEAIAVTYAGLDVSTVSFLFSKEDIEDGIAVFEVSFREGSYAYDVTVHAETGEVLEFEKDGA